jgi:hypothetical protein
MYCIQQSTNKGAQPGQHKTRLVKTSFKIGVRTGFKTRHVRYRKTMVIMVNIVMMVIMVIMVFMVFMAIVVVVVVMIVMVIIWMC